ncbi:MAG: Fpg/Nei family DNA glycosylase [Actinobacteria bacterium]|nr:Fpg/Nei family DNA glycosylase [Actinomycetota bacterium]
MPEIPEVRAHAERLSAELAGRELARFTALTFTVLKTFDPRPDASVGQPLTEVTSYAKYLLLRFGAITHVVHLMQGGRLKPDPKQSKKPRGGLARWTFTDGTALLLTEPGTERRAGVWVVDGGPTAQAPISELGPLATDLSAAALGELMSEHSMRLHGFIRSQRVIAGLGRRLANEICHQAKISPFATSSRLSANEVERVHSAIHTKIDEGLAYDRGRDDMSKSAERPSSVHGRIGEPCPVCNDKIRSVEYRKYTVIYCPTCQTNGRRLADNTTSKFLK